MEGIKYFRLPRILDKRGNLSVFENDQYFPFEMKTFSWLSTDTSICRETELSKTTSGITMIILTGKVELILFDGEQTDEIVLDDLNNCLYVPPGIYMKLVYSSAHTAAFIMSNDLYEFNNPFIQFFQSNQIANAKTQTFG